jgi:hypothetical protein
VYTCAIVPAMQLEAVGRQLLLIETRERLSELASDPRASSYSRQEGFEYLGITVGYISWILRNSRAISP